MAKPSLSDIEPRQLSQVSKLTRKARESCLSPLNSVEICRFFFVSIFFFFAKYFFIQFAISKLRTCMVFSETVSSAVKAYKGIQVTSKKMIG